MVGTGVSAQVSALIAGDDWVHAQLLELSDDEDMPAKRSRNDVTDKAHLPHIRAVAKQVFRTDGVLPDITRHVERESSILAAKAHRSFCLRAKIPKLQQQADDPPNGTACPGIKPYRLAVGVPQAAEVIDDADLSFYFGIQPCTSYRKPRERLHLLLIQKKLGFAAIALQLGSLKKGLVKPDIVVKMTWQVFVESIDVDVFMMTLGWS